MASAAHRKSRAKRQSRQLATRKLRATEAVDSAPAAMPRFAKNKIKLLPAPLKTELDRRLNQMTFASYAALARWLEAEGYQIHRTALGRYGRQFDRQLAAVKIASEQARIVCEQFEGDEASMQEALMRLVQTEMFNLLVDVTEHRIPLRSGRKKRSANAALTAVDLGAVARTVGGLVKTSIAHQQWVAKLKEKVATGVAAAAEKIEAVKSEGLSEDAAAKIRDALLEIRV